MTVHGVPEEYFREMYRGSADPWSLAERWYEERKYALTLAALPARRYRRAFEPGCSVGVLSARLAGRCDELLSWDREAAAVEQAALRLRTCPNAHAAAGTVPGQWPDGAYDLIVLSEVLYYLGTAELERTARAATASLEPGGHLVVAHWRHPVAEHAHSAEHVHGVIGAQAGLARLARHEEPDFLLEVYVRYDPTAAPDQETVAARYSVAAMEGLA
jgi:protein-L-isoaspartate O-methyltransferase